MISLLQLFSQSIKGTQSKMKANFMQNLSDQIVKQNYRLKDQVTKLAYKINDYEEQIIGVITAMTPSIGVYEDPQEMLSQFVKQFQRQKKEFDKLKKDYGKLKEMCQQLKTEAVSHLNQLQLKKTQEEQQRLKWQGEKTQMKNEYQSSQKEMQKLKINFNQLKKNIDNLTIQKLKMEETRRQQIEEVGLEHHIELITLKKQIEKQHLKVEKMLREELQTKNQTIREMSRFVEQMKKTEGNDMKNSAFLEQIFQKLQKVNELSNTLEELREENSILRLKKDDLQASKASLQLKLKESKTAEYNMQSQIRRVNIYNQDLQSKLTIKINQLLKCQKQKEEMDKYYHTRWIEEYNRLKNRLTKQSLEKIKEVQQDCNEKIEGMKARMNQAIEMENKMMKRNQLLEEIYNQDQKDKNQLQLQIKKIEQKNQQYRSIIKQSDMMNNQNISQLKFIFNQQRKQLQKKISDLARMLESKNKDIIAFKQQHCLELQNLQKIKAEVLAYQQKLFESEKKKITEKHENQISKISAKILKQSEDHQEVKKQIERQYQQRIENMNEEFKMKLEEKDQQNIKNHQKWVDRFRQTEKQHNNTSNKLKQSIEELRNQIQNLQENEKKLKECRDDLLQKIDQMSIEITFLEGKIVELEKIIINKNESEINLKSKIQILEKDLLDSHKEVEVLINMRTDWKRQLSDLQYDLRQEFTDLKKENEKEKGVLRQKIKQLQNLNQRKMINRHEYQEFKALEEQKNGIEEQMHVKQVQNAILTQIKQYYESRLKEAENHISKVELKSNHSLLSRKIKRSRLRESKQITSQRVFETVERESQNQLQDSKRYTIRSYQKHFNLSLSKAKLEEYTGNNNNNRTFRVKTSYAI